MLGFYFQQVLVNRYTFLRSPVPTISVLLFLYEDNLVIYGDELRNFGGKEKVRQYRNEALCFVIMLCD